MAVYLSIDTEATGLKEPNYLIQLAMIPLDTEQGIVFSELGKEWLVHCPSYEILEPTLDDWNRKHNKDLIIQAHNQGISKESLLQAVEEYLNLPMIKKIFGKNRPVFLGKSLSALDIPMLKRYFGWDFYDKNFHYHTLDVTCVARMFVDTGVLPQGTQSTSKIVQYFGIREQARHTALSDATDMAEIYLRMVQETRKSIEKNERISFSKKNN